MQTEIINIFGVDDMEKYLEILEKENLTREEFMPPW